MKVLANETSPMETGSDSTGTQTFQCALWRSASRCQHSFVSKRRTKKKLQIVCTCIMTMGCPIYTSCAIQGAASNAPSIISSLRCLSMSKLISRNRFRLMWGYSDIHNPDSGKYTSFKACSRQKHHVIYLFNCHCFVQLTLRFLRSHCTSKVKQAYAEILGELRTPL